MQVTSTVSFMWVPIAFDALQLILDFAYGIPIFRGSSSSSSSSSTGDDLPNLDILELLKGSRFFKLESLTRACDDFSHRLASAEVDRERKARGEETASRRRVEGRPDGEKRRLSGRSVEAGEVEEEEARESLLVQVPVISSGEVTTTQRGEEEESGEEKGREDQERKGQDEQDDVEEISEKEKEDAAGEVDAAEEGEVAESVEAPVSQVEGCEDGDAITMTITAVEPVRKPKFLDVPSHLYKRSCPSVRP